MTNGATLLINWLDANILKSYQEPAPSTAELPYISFEYAEGPFAEETLQQLTIWTRKDSSYTSAFTYSDLISEALGEAGLLLKGTDVNLWLKKGSNFIQPRQDDTKTIRAVLVNLEISKY